MFAPGAKPRGESRGYFPLVTKYRGRLLDGDRTDAQTCASFRGERKRVLEEFRPQGWHHRSGGRLRPLPRRRREVELSRG